MPIEDRAQANTKKNKKRNKKKKIKTIIVKSNQKENSLAAIIENVQREDLNVLEEAEAYSQLIINHKMKHEDIAEKTGKSRSYVTNIVRLIGLKEKVKAFLPNCL